MSKAQLFFCGSKLPFFCLIYILPAALQYPHCSIIIRDAFSCCPVEEAEDARRWLAGDDSHADICEPPLEVTDYQAGCDPHKWHTIHTIEDVLFALTIAILSIMMLELLLLIAAITPCIFFRHFWYGLDFFIVSVSLALEATFKVVDEENLAAYIGVIVLFRCWRFVRISHGLIEVTVELTSEKYEEVISLANEVEDLFAKHQQKMASLQGGNDTDTEAWESESVTEIRKKSKELADQVLATASESNDEIHLGSMGKDVMKAARRSRISKKIKHTPDEKTADGTENGR